MSQRLEFLHSLIRLPSHPIQSHRHGCHELVFYLSGHGTTRIGGQSWRFQAGDVAIQLAGILHDERHDVETDVLFVGFHADSAQAGIADGVYRSTATSRIQPLLEEMRLEMHEHRPLYVRKLEALLQVLLVEAARLCSTARPASVPDDGLAHAERFLREHFTQDTDYAALAAQAGYSYDRFRHLFRQQYGVPPHRHVIRLRLSMSRDLLTGSRLPIATIAQDLGFAGESQFIALFHREYGCTPGAFRRMQGDDLLFLLVSKAVMRLFHES